MSAYKEARRKEAIANLMMLGVLLVAIAAFVAALAPRWETYTPKRAQVEHTYRETYLEPVEEDSASVVDSLNRCNASGQLTCDFEAKPDGTGEVIGTPTTTSTTSAPAQVQAQAPARPSADLTDRASSEADSPTAIPTGRSVSTTASTVPTYRDVVVVPPPDRWIDVDHKESADPVLDCTAHGDPFQPACQTGATP